MKYSKIPKRSKYDHFSIAVDVNQLMDNIEYLKNKIDKLENKLKKCELENELQD